MRLTSLFRTYREHSGLSRIVKFKLRHYLPEASVAPAAPTAYLADDGAFIHRVEATPNAALTDRDLMIYGMKAGFGRTGAKIGSRDGDGKLFCDDMVAFWLRVMTGRGQPAEQLTDPDLRHNCALCLRKLSSAKTALIGCREAAPDTGTSGLL
jgi:hypothetical protein